MIHTISLCLPHLHTPPVFLSHLSTWGLFSKCIWWLIMAQHRKLWTLQGKASRPPLRLSYKTHVLWGWQLANLLTFIAEKNDAEIKSYLCERDIWTSRIQVVRFQPPRSSVFESTSLLSHAFFQQDDLNWVPATSSGKILWINPKAAKFSFIWNPK